MRSQSNIQDGDDDDYDKQNVVLMMTIRILTNFAQVFVFDGMQGGNGFRMIVFSRGRFLVRSPASFGFLEILPKINLDDFNQSFEQHHVEVFCDA